MKTGAYAYKRILKWKADSKGSVKRNADRSKTIIGILGFVTQILKVLPLPNTSKPLTYFSSGYERRGNTSSKLTGT